MAAKKSGASRGDAEVRRAVAGLRERPSARVLVIGGGINGIGVFRDLALQGVDVALVERGDFASGASAASSHMIHGGIRYLENGEFHLVRESVRERNGLLKTAPHYVKPLRTTIPIFSTFSGILAAPLRFVTHRQRSTVERGALLIKLGLVLYDSFSRDGGTLPRHAFHGRTRSLAELPELNRDVKYTATYFDASVHEPERLALDVLTDGLAAGPHARAANYVSAAGVRDGGVLLHDELHGAEFLFRADVVVNASGPWTDATNGILGAPTRFMGGTKGSHIVLDHPRLRAALAGRELFFENSDGRIVLIYPLREKVMVGTTDIDTGVDEPARCTPEEVEYFIDLVRHVLPGITVDPEQIVYRFAGVRPLPRHDDLQPGFVSRDYHVAENRDPRLGGATVLSLVGGKWTTFRAVAETITDRVLELVGGTRRVATSGLPIGGGRDYPSSQAARARWISGHAAGLPADRVSALLDRYGTRATDVIAYLGEHGDDPLAATERFTAGELAFMADEEFVVHVDDVLLRRTNVAFDGEVTAALVEEVARAVATALGWDADRVRDEIARATRILTDDHQVTLDGHRSACGHRGETAPEDTAPEDTDADAAGSGPQADATRALR